MGLVVTTVMANLGLDKALAEAGIRTVKTQVGDRYVLEEMVKIGANLGGEQSGHLLFLDQTATGDGIVSALQLLAVMRETGQPLSALASCMSKFPQVLVNVRDSVQQAIARGATEEQALATIHWPQYEKLRGYDSQRQVVIRRLYQQLTGALQ